MSKLNEKQTKRVNDIIKGLTTTSSKIRALDKAGYSRSEIAATLNKRYQHVRNVLTSPVPKTEQKPAPKRVRKAKTEQPTQEAGN